MKLGKFLAQGRAVDDAAATRRPHAVRPAAPPAVAPRPAPAPAAAPVAVAAGRPGSS